MKGPYNKTMNFNDCPAIKKQLTLYRDGLLDRIQSETICKHLLDCRECSELFGNLVRPLSEAKGLMGLIDSATPEFRHCFSVDTLDRYAHGELTSEERHLVQDHLRECEFCTTIAENEILSMRSGRLHSALSALKLRSSFAIPRFAVIAAVAIVLLVAGLLPFHRSREIRDIAFPAVSYPAPSPIKGGTIASETDRSIQTNMDSIEKETVGGPRSILDPALELQVAEAWRQERWSEVESLLIQAKAEAPDLPSLDLFLGICLIRLDRPEEALAVLGSGLARAPLQGILPARFHLARAEAFSDLDNCSATRKALQEAGAAYPVKNQEIVKLSESLTRQGCSEPESTVRQ